MRAHVPVKGKQILLGFLILAFITLPVIELLLLLRIGSWLGALPTILLLVVTGVIGAAVARSQGVQVLARIRQDLAAGRPPVGSMVDGALILVAGVLLITPGVITDALGILLLLPPSRTLVRRFLGKRMKRMVDTGAAQFTIFPGPAQPPPSPPDRRAPGGRDVTDL